MTSILPNPQSELTVARPEPGHALGDVSSDWEAAAVWLTAVARKSSNGSTATRDTYAFHLAKLRWYCENVGRVTPSRWNMQDVEHFYMFLEDLPEDAVCPLGKVGTLPPANLATARFEKGRREAVNRISTVLCTPCSRPGIAWVISESTRWD